MTRAYLEGFKKTAEEHGIDPELLKKAQTAFGKLGPTIDAAEWENMDKLMDDPRFVNSIVDNLPSIGLRWFLSNPGHEDARRAVYENVADKAEAALSVTSPKIKIPDIKVNLSDRGLSAGTRLHALFNTLRAILMSGAVKRRLALGAGGALAGGIAGYKLLSKNRKKEKPEKKASYDSVLKLAQQGLGVTGPRVDTAKLDSMAKLMGSPQADIQFEKALPSEGMLRYLSGPGHKDAFNAALAKAWAAAKDRSTNPKVPGPGTAPKAPLHIAQPPKVPAVKLPQPK